jgi:hypothetical protein
VNRCHNINMANAEANLCSVTIAASLLDPPVIDHALFKGMKCRNPDTYDLLQVLEIVIIHLRQDADVGQNKKSMERALRPYARGRGTS